jgi:hypothetical protein
MRAKLVILMLAAALALVGGAAGVIAANDGGSQSAAKSQFGCDTDDGNGTRPCDPRIERQRRDQGDS